MTFFVDVRCPFGDACSVEGCVRARGEDSVRKGDADAVFVDRPGCFKEAEDAREDG